ncbi:MAG TPA: ribosome small subunit-dependent GTPase A [Lachnospiraceae bacterium]|nr:ribosome small subunit-dependent GTPase A [Lachnospiraceae bacterium]
MLNKGKILKGIGGFYYVAAENDKIYECKAKGVFRNVGIKPLVGDDCLISIISEDDCTGNIEAISERRSELIRPAAANADQAVIIFALTNPEPSLGLLDRYLVMMADKDIDIIICFNKEDSADAERVSELKGIYDKAGFKVVTVSAHTGQGVDGLKKLLEGKTTILAGPSGVGKSSMMNAILPHANAVTGELSEKIKRGKNTTRHTELIRISHDTYIMDTPGFSSIFVQDMDGYSLRMSFPEIAACEGKCRFDGCNHINEPDCEVKAALERGEIAPSRYQSYVSIYEEIKNRRKW